MMQTKPSELPLNTIIDFDDDEFIKVKSYYGIRWETLACQDCRGGDSLTDTQADAKFTKFKIISVPFTMIQYLAVDIMDMPDNDFTEEFLIKDAMKHHLDKGSVEH